LAWFGIVLFMHASLIIDFHQEQHLEPHPQPVPVGQRQPKERRQQLQQQKQGLSPDPSNPYEGWAPPPYVDDGGTCTSWRVCFNDDHGCPGFCRDSQRVFDEDPPPPSMDADWVPDVTMLRRMLLRGVDSTNRTWPPPLVGTTTDGIGRELCEPMNPFGRPDDDTNKQRT
jgi:hypothetical protein